MTTPLQPEVYFIDDDAASLASMVFLARTADLSARGFTSAWAFLEDAAGLRPGCVVTDLRMPEMDGFELLERLARLTDAHRTIVITGHGDQELAERACRAGAIAFLEKPFAIGELVAAIRGA